MLVIARVCSELLRSCVAASREGLDLNLTIVDLGSGTRAEIVELPTVDKRLPPESASIASAQLNGRHGRCVLLHLAARSR